MKNFDTVGTHLFIRTVIWTRYIRSVFISIENILCWQSSYNVAMFTKGFFLLSVDSRYELDNWIIGPGQVDIFLISQLDGHKIVQNSWECFCVTLETLRQYNIQLGNKNQLFKL